MRPPPPSPLPTRCAVVVDPLSGLPCWPSSAYYDGASLYIGAAADERRDGAPSRYVAAVRRAVDAGTPVRLGEREFSGADLVSGYLRALATEAERVHGGRISRLALTVPPGYQPADPRREAMISIAAAAGFPAAELMSDAVATALDPAAGLGLSDDALVLVCDLGATWTVALLQARGEHAVQLAQETSGAGRDIDRLLLQDLRLTMPDAVEPLLGRSGEAGMQAYYQVTCFLRRLKHQLSEVGRTSGQLPALGIPYHLTRAELERFAEPALRWLLASCRAVVAKAGATLADITAVLVGGGCSRIAGAQHMIHVGLGLPVVQAPDPELAAVRGAARWAANADQRRLPPERPRWRVEPLSWKIPGGPARLLRWLVDEGQPYPADALLAQIRTADDRVYDLAADREGVLLEQRLPPGATVTSAAVVGTTRAAAPLAGGEPTRRHRYRSDGDWLLTTDRGLVVEWTELGGFMRAREISSGVSVAEVRPPPGPRIERASPAALAKSTASGSSTSYGGRPYVGPDGRLAFVSWDPDGHFTVWDALSGAVLSKFKTPDRPARVLVDEVRCRLVAESGKRARVGRYQRDVATVWDLRTGRLTEEMVGEELQRRYVGFAARTAADAFGAEATSPDAQLHVLAAADGAAVTVREAETGREIFRAEAPTDGGRPAKPPRVGFSGDGRQLLVHWPAAVGGWVDVWDVVTPAT